MDSAQPGELTKVDILKAFQRAEEAPPMLVNVGIPEQSREAEDL